MVFRKRGRLLPTEHWTYNGSDIEVVVEFHYLGAVFHYTGNVNVNQEYLVRKALKAMNFLFNNCSEFDIKPKILCQLFDTFVSSTLNYSCEICGKSKSKVLYLYGFSETFDNVLTTNTNLFVNQFKTRVVDTYKSE